jgi:glycosyltransferase involved in cell wall biosynthesis
MRLTAKALTRAGVHTKVLLTRVSERPPLVRNTLTEGEWEGVSFKYTTGGTARSEWFLVRRWAELRGILGAIAIIVSDWRAGQLDCIYLWICYWEEQMPLRVFRGLCSLLGVRVVCELSEPSAAVWEGAPLSQDAGQRDFLLTNVDGFVAISEGLEEWVRSRKGGDRPEIMRLPVLVDTDEVEPSFARATRNDLFYAAASTYVDEIEFVLQVVDAVRERYPDVRIRFSGWQIADIARPSLRERLQALVDSGSAVVEGTLSRERLIESYRASAALLLPMKDESRSFARCPTKVGEYLASGRPVVATAIGELEVLLTDGENAFLAAPGDVRSFADAVLSVLANPERACVVGRNGRALAEQVLDYRRYAEPLREFFTEKRPNRPG